MSGRIREVTLQKKAFAVELLRRDPAAAAEFIKRSIKKRFGTGAHHSVVIAARKEVGVPAKARDTQPTDSRHHRQSHERALDVAIQSSLHEAAKVLIQIMKTQGISDVSLKVSGEMRIVRVVSEVIPAMEPHE